MGTWAKGQAHSSRKWYNANRRKVKAQVKVSYEIRAGHMKRRSCIVCGQPNGQAHHGWGYEPENELRVVFVCPKHHNKADRDPTYNQELIELHAFVESI